MGYDQKTIEQVQSLNDIVEVVSGYIPLKRGGRSFKTCCPFHQEKTPSFNVNPERQIFHCFGCGEGGDVISFVMKFEQIGFPEALKMLAERVHMELPESGFQRSEKSHADILYQIYDAAQAFYHAFFMKSEAAGRARAYWKERGFGEKEAVQFGIGYSPEDWRKLFEYLSQKGFKQDLLIRSGLIAKSAQGNPYDWFRGRLMFPIRNAQSRVMAFGGRVLSPKETPKYLNSPETEIFKKRREFYGLFTAKNALTQQGNIRQILIVEGYLDCIQLQASGFLNTVATLGTSLTEEHVRILKRYADEAIVVYDGDRAGEQAALRGLDIFLEEGMSARAIALPSGFDPDDFVRTKGKEALQEQITQAQDVFDFKLKILLARFNKADSSGLLKITSEFLDTLAKVNSQVLLDRYLKKLAGTLGVEERSLRFELEKLKSKTSVQRRSQISQAQSVPNRAPDPPNEKMMLALILERPDYLNEFKEALPNYQFQGERTRELFQLITDHTAKNPRPFSSSGFINQIRDGHLKTFASELMIMEWNDEAIKRSFRDCLKKIRQVIVSNQLRELQNRIARAEGSGDLGLVTTLIQEYKELLVLSKNTE